MNLLTTQEEYESLASTVEGRAKTVRVNAQALQRLLIDHSALVRHAKAHGYKVIEPTHQQPALRRTKTNLT